MEDLEESRRLLDVSAYKNRKQQLSEENRSVVRPIPRIDDDIIPSKKKGGRPFRYSPTKLKNQINKYFQWCEDNDEIPSISGLMIHCKMYKDSFYKYIKVPEYSDLLEHTRLIITNWVANDIYNTKGMCAGKGLYAKNVIGWADKVESFNQTETRVVSVDEARAKIEMLAPKLLELLKSNNLVDQLVVPNNAIEGEVVA